MAETVTTKNGIIEYSLTRKRVRNINLRIKTNGEVAVSAPNRVPKWEIETFIQSRSQWIIKNQQRVKSEKQYTFCYTKEECMAVFTMVSDRIYPLFADILKGKKPIIRVREMKTRWGTCNLKTKTITLNSHLMEKPYAALEYVVLHEYVHFIHPNHQAGFHAEMARLMPDYKQRRKLLRAGQTEAAG